MSTAFLELGVPAELSDVLADAGITEPTPIQAATLPDSLAGRDVLGRGRTGSGKTLAFLLPLVARLDTSRSRRTPKRPRALVLAPTRELVSQIEAALAPLARVHGLRTRTVFGGVGQHPQVQALRAGVDVLVACPGRLEDLINHPTLKGHMTVLASSPDASGEVVAPLPPTDSPFESQYDAAQRKKKADMPLKKAVRLVSLAKRFTKRKSEVVR